MGLNRGMLRGSRHPCGELMCVVVFRQNAAVEPDGYLTDGSRKWEYPVRGSESAVLGALR